MGESKPKDRQNHAVIGLRKQILRFPDRRDVDSDDNNNDDKDADFQVNDNNCSSSKESDGSSRKGDQLAGNLLQTSNLQSLI